MNALSLILILRKILSLRLIILYNLNEALASDKVSPVLPEIHRQVVDALASLPSQVGEGPSNQSEDVSYRQFINSLARSGSDKAFTIQKEYRSLLDPIAENVGEKSGQYEELVDYDSSDNSQASDTPFLSQGQGILTLAAPIIERTDECSQPDPDTQEDPLSQVDNPPVAAASPGGGNFPNTGAGEDQRPHPARMSSRIGSLGAHNLRIDTRAMETTNANNIPGTNLNSHNSFALLDDDDILSRALEMGVDTTSLSLEKVNYLKDLEIARHAIITVQDSAAVSDNVDTQQALFLGLGSDQSDSDKDVNEDDFTPVLSKKKEIQEVSLQDREKWITGKIR
jgi:hypothetical protein